MSYSFITTFLAFVAFFVFLCIGTLFNVVCEPERISSKKEKHINIFDFSVCFLFAVIISMQFASYPFIPKGTGVDSAVFMYIGKMMHSGAIPYKDLFDHKGVILYFIQYLAGFFNDIKIGIWLLEVLNLTICAYFMLKTSKLLTQNRVIQFVAVAVVCGVCIRKVLQGGNFVEEYALPWISSSLYLFFKWFKCQQTKFIDIMWIGFSFAVVFFLRPNMISLWISLIPVIIVLLISQKKWSELFKCILWFCVGMAVVCGFLLVYFLITDSLNEMVDLYFRFNLIYTGSESSVKSVLISAIKLSIYSITMIPTLLLTFVSEVKKKNKIYIYNFVALVISVMMTSMSGRAYRHYGIIFLPFLIVPLIITLEKIFNFVEKRAKIKKKNNGREIVACIAVIAVTLVGYNLLDRSFGTAQQREDNFVVDYVTENTQPDDDVLFLGNNCWYYLYSDRSTKNKYFYQTPPINVDDNIYDAFVAEIKEKPSDFIVCLGDRSDNSAENNNIGKIYRYYDELCSKGEYNCFESEEDFYVYIKLQRGG